MANGAAPAGRAERLVQLLENAGTAPGVRMTAAKQLGQHVQHLYSVAGEGAAAPAAILLNRLIRILLVNKSWEVRIATASALQSMCQQVSQHEETALTVEDDQEHALKLLKDFEMLPFIDAHEPLVASSGTEFEVDFSTMSAAERIRLQKIQLKKTFQIVEGFDDMMTQELVEDRDLAETQGSLAVADLACAEAKDAPPARELSAREKAMLRKRDRASSRATAPAAAAALKKCTAKLELPESEKFIEASVSDSKLRALLVFRSNVLNANWSVRHGALLGIKALMVSPEPKWPRFLLSILAKDVLCVLALDRFGDFVSDQVVAPVRETAAQALATLYNLHNGERDLLVRRRLWEVVLVLAQHPFQWQVLHAGLLSIKYLLALDDSVLADPTTFATLIDVGMHGFCDMDEDVRSLSAELLARLLDSPSSQSIPRDKIAEMYDTTVALLEDNGEENSIATATLVNALGLVEKVKPFVGRDVDRCIAMLLTGMMRHPMSAVRGKVLWVMDMLDLSTLSGKDRVLMTKLLIQNIVLDDCRAVVQSSARLANKTAAGIEPSSELLPTIVALCTILLTPRGRPFEARNFTFVERVEGGEPVASACCVSHEIGFKPSDMMMIQEANVTFARRAASNVLAQLCSLYGESVRQRIAKALVGPDPLCQCAGLWVFGVDSGVRFDQDSVAGDRDGLWDLRLHTAFCLACPHPEAPVDVSMIIRHLGLEADEQIQEDVAAVLSRIYRPEILDTVLGCLVRQETRNTALPTLVKMLDRIESHGRRPDLQSGSSLEERIAMELLAFSALGLEASMARVPSVLPLLQQALCTAHETPLWEEGLALDLLERLFKKATGPMVSFFVKDVLPQLKMGTVRGERLVILRATKAVFERAQDELSCFAGLFLVPVLGRIADSDGEVRALASVLFGMLVRLVPLGQGADAAGKTMDAQMAREQESAREFLAQFLGDSVDDLINGGQTRASAIAQFEIPVEIRGELRAYQHSGVSWLAFLNRYGLNGVLCDDMGLGKTLQTICMLASDHHNRQVAGLPHLPTLVVCPSSLVGHWRHEIRAYAPSLAEPVMYCGAPGERRHAWKRAAESMVVVTSYEVVRSDTEVLQRVHWNYIVLDEGHIIKNPKTKLSGCVKMLKAEHRLILSGTPIQNNVVELWSLFDFLMPGMLGTEAEFMDRYGRAIMAVQPGVSGSGTAKASSAGGTGSLRDFEEAERRLKALHKQVLPFLLRRMKEDVLKELPPKIIQDYECEASPIQRLLYEEVFKASLQQQVAESLAGDGGAKPAMHVFQALQYLRKTCVHPGMVLTPDHPQWDQVQEMLAGMSASSIDDLRVSPKLLMLKELLEECGIGAEAAAVAGEGDGGLVDGGVQEGHRVLIFAQQKATLDLIERLVLQVHMPQTRYLRLDGSVESRERFEIAQRFNADLSIGVMLLTTQVGGLGLNLTGADTVVFVEHDWNPMKDLQAMDRAHRLGQRRVVSVYRLIVKDTLEQQIMGLQRWKTRVASTIVQQQDVSVTSDAHAKLQPRNLLDLLAGSPAGEGADADQRDGAGPAQKRSKGEAAMQSWLAKHSATLLEADDDSPLADGNAADYAKAFDMEQFVQSATDNKQ